MGYLSTQIYSSLQKRVTSDKLFYYTLSGMLVLVLVMRLGLYFVDEKWLSIFVFIWAMPLLTLIGLESNGLAMRLLDLRQMKRLMGYINIGGVTASIFGYILIPVLVKFIGHQYNLLYIAAFGVICSMVVLYMILKKFPEKIIQQTDKNIQRPTTSFADLFKDRYLVLIISAATLATIVIYFTDFIYLAVVREQPGLGSDPKKVALFISLVAATFRSGELVVSYFTGRLLSQYGLGLGLTLLPYASTFIIICATFSGLIGGQTSVLFFVLIVFNKIYDRTIRKSIDDISFNILYQPLQSKQKFEVQTKIGIVAQVSVGVAGVLLLLISRFLIADNAANLKYFNLFFVPILVLWSFVASKLYIEYKKRLRQFLQDASKNLKRDIYKHIYGSEILTKKFKKFNSEVVTMSVTILSETNAGALEPYAASLLESENPTIIKAILRNVDPTWRPKLGQTFVKLQKTNLVEEDVYIKNITQRAIDYLNFNDLPVYKKSDFEKFSKHTPDDEKLNLLKYFIKSKSCEYDDILIQLLDDKEKMIKTSAIDLAVKSSNPKVHKILLDLLKSPEYYHIISNSLLELGEKIVPDLDELFTRESNQLLLLRIIEIYAKIGSESTQEILLKYINYPSKEIQEATIRALHFSRYEAKEEQEPLIKEKVFETIENIIWSYAAINDIENEKNTLKLFQSLDLERENNFEKLFKLLSFIFPAKTINLIKKNIIGENTIFALEIIDNFISQDIKQLIIPLFDNISVTNRIRKLNHVFPQENMKLSDRLKNIIMRDFNKVDLWTVAMSLELLGKIHRAKKSKDIEAHQTGDLAVIDYWTHDKANEILRHIRKSEIPDEVFLCLYHPDELVYSSAARIIYEENPSRCLDYLSKLPDRQELMEILSNSSKQKQLMPERIRLLKRHPLFFSVPQNILVRLAKYLKVKQLKSDERVFFEDNDKNEVIIILINGTLYHNHETSEKTEFSQNEIIVKGLNIDEKVEYLVGEKGTIVLIGERFEYFNILVDETDLLQNIFDGIQKGPDEKESES